MFAFVDNAYVNMAVSLIVVELNVHLERPDEPRGIFNEQLLLSLYELGNSILSEDVEE